MKRRELTFVITALILGAVIGGVVGDVIGTFLPAGAAKTVFTKSIQIGFSPTKVDYPDPEKPTRPTRWPGSMITFSLLKTGCSE